MGAVQESRFEYKSYPCVVLFMDLCHRCGYVGIKKGNKYYRKDYDGIPIDCHGGLTYSSEHLHSQDDEDVWWIGFDCMHYGDGDDYEKGKEYFKDDEFTLNEIKLMQERLLQKEGKIWSLQEVEEECRKIVEQLIELEENGFGK